VCWKEKHIEWKNTPARVQGRYHAALVVDLFIHPSITTNSVMGVETCLYSEQKGHADQRAEVITSNDFGIAATEIY